MLSVPCKCRQDNCSCAKFESHTQISVSFACGNCGHALEFYLQDSYTNTNVPNLTTPIPYASFPSIVLSQLPRHESLQQSSSLTPPNRNFLPVFLGVTQVTTISPPVTNVNNNNLNNQLKHISNKKPCRPPKTNLEITLYLHEDIFQKKAQPT